MQTQSCQVCGAMVPSQMVQQHEEWHERISQVAIESTQRIDALTQRLNEVLNAHL